MYFDFEDYHPDITPVGQAISWREGILLSIIVHLLLTIVVLVAPRWFPNLFSPSKPQALALARESQPNTTFVFVQPRRDVTAPRPPVRGEASDKDRLARAPERAPNPRNPLPFSRGNTPERVDELSRSQPRGRGPAPEPAAGEPSKNREEPTDTPPLQESASSLQVPQTATQVARNGMNGRSTTPGGSLGEALKNLQRYTRGEVFDNPQGQGGQFGPEIQFDTKGVEFGPWIRRFVAQVKRNWFVPYAAMSIQGHVVITFNVHKDGSLTDLSVVGPSTNESFNNAAYGALSGSNPTQPLPPEYPSEHAFFTVTFFYNETPR